MFDRLHLKYCELSGQSTIIDSPSGEFVLYDDFLESINEKDRRIKELEKELQKYKDVVEAAKESINFNSAEYIYDKECGNLVDRYVPLVNLMEALNQLEGESE